MTRSKKTQADAVAEAMAQLGGFATLALLSKTTMAVPGVEWKTKTPYASIRRIVQLDSRFFRVRPGLWGLQAMKNSSQFATAVLKPTSEEGLQFTHAYFQGLLLKLGSLQNQATYVALQDKNKMCLTEPLHELATVDRIPDFGYSHLVRQASTVDVVWFNRRQMPSSFFEVEHTTDIQNSLVKFNELQDFNSEFRIVADSVRLEEYKVKIGKDTFSGIRNRVKFVSFEMLAHVYDKTSQLHTSRSAW